MLNEQAIRDWRNEAEKEWQRKRAEWKERPADLDPQYVLKLEDRIYELKITVEVLTRVLNGEYELSGRLAGDRTAN